MHNIPFTLRAKQLIQKVYAALNVPITYDLLVYLSGSIIVRSISILIMPALLRVLCPEAFGQLALITSFIAIGIAISGLGLRQVLAADFFGLSHEQQIATINMIIIMYCIIVLPCIVVCIYAAPLLQQYLFCAQINPIAMRLAALHIFLFFFAELTYQWLQYQRQVERIMKVQITSALTITILTYCFVWILHWGIVGVVAAQLVGLFIPVITGCTIFFANNFHQPVERSPIAQSVAYLKRGIPFIQTVLFAWILAAGDRWMLARMSSLHNVGIYAVADTACQLFYFFILYPWTAAYLPHMLKRYHQEKDGVGAVEQQNQQVMMITLLILFMFITAGIMFLQPLAHLIIPPTYQEALSYVWILLMGQLCLLGGSFASCLLQFYKKGLFLALALAIPALVNIAGNAVMIPYFGLYGCAVATFASYLLYFALTLGYNRYLLLQQARSGIV